MGVRWASNHAAVADREFAIARIRAGRMEILPDPREDRWVEILLDGQELPTLELPEIERHGTAATGELDLPPLAHMTIANHEGCMEGMTVEEQRDYLWDVVRMDAAHNLNRLGRVIDTFGRTADGKLRLKVMPARLFLIMWDGRGRTLTHGYLSQRMEQETGIVMDQTMLVAHVKRIRAALAEMDWPVQLHTAYGLGWRMDAPELWQPPWDAKAWLILKDDPS